MPETINVCVFCGAIVSPRGQNENQNRLCEGAFGMAAEKSGAGELGELPPGLAGLVAQAGHAAKARPVERWDPPYCGEIDMRIAADGAWYYRGSVIAREALVRLFASILRREPDGRHVLVTPVEKVGIEVADAPFLAVEVLAEGEGRDAVLTFRTNVGDLVPAGPDHPLRFETEAETAGLKPYIRVRGGLDALASRALALELVEMSGEQEGAAGIWSGGMFFLFPDASIG
jgi:hypothetical protein